MYLAKVKINSEIPRNNECKNTYLDNVEINVHAINTHQKRYTNV